VFTDLLDHETLPAGALAATSFTADRREVTRSMVRSPRTATTAAHAAVAATALLAQPIQLDRHRHRPCVTKRWQRFPSAASAVTTTATGTVSLCAPDPDRGAG
jgi:hypothetical protein